MKARNKANKNIISSEVISKIDSYINDYQNALLINALENDLNNDSDSNDDLLVTLQSEVNRIVEWRENNVLHGGKQENGKERQATQTSIVCDEATRQDLLKYILHDDDLNLLISNSNIKQLTKAMQFSQFMRGLRAMPSGIQNVYRNSVNDWVTAKWACHETASDHRNALFVLYFFGLIDVKGLKREKSLLTKAFDMKSNMVKINDKGKQALSSLVAVR